MRFFFRLFIIFVSTCAAAQQRSLDYFIQSAINNSPLFMENKNQIESFRYDSMLTRALLKPQVSFDSRNVYAPAIKGYGYDNIITNGGEFSAVVGMNLSLAGRQNLDNRFQKIQLQMQLMQLAGKLNEKELKQNITSLYITVFGEQEMLRNSREILNVLQTEDTILKKLTERGIYRQTEYLSFLVNYKQQELIHEQKRQEIINSLATLYYLCGIADTNYIELENPGVKKNSSVSSEQTLAFQQYMLDSLVLKNNYESVQFDYRPHFNLFGDAGYLSSLSFESEKNFGFRAGFDLAFPIYDGWQRDLRYGKIKLSENTRMNYLQFYRKQYDQKHLRLQQLINNNEGLIAEAQKQLSLSQALLDANRKLLGGGEVRMADYILALTNYISAKSTSIQLGINRMQLINEFNNLNY